MFTFQTGVTLGARGFSCAVSGFGQVLKGDPREKLRRSCQFGLRPNTCRPAADKVKLPVAREKKTSGTQGKQELKRFSIAIVAKQNTRTKSKVTCQISKKKMHESDGAKGGKMHAISCEYKIRAV